MPSREIVCAAILSGLIFVPFATTKEPKAELTLKDADGRRVRLSDYRGKLVVLNFWATWCGPCASEMPTLVEAEKTYSGRVVFIAASLDDGKSRSNVPEFLNKYHVTFPVWFGATGDDLAKLDMGPAVPATAFIDEDGHIISRIWGQFREPELKERLEWMTGPRTGPAPQAVVKHLEK